MDGIKQTISKYHEILIALGLFFSFLLVTIPGISWGLPDLWNPDELVHWVERALNGKTPIDTVNFDYPSLPKWTMYLIGKVIYHFGYAKTELMLVSRALSVVLGGLIVVMCYRITRIIGGSIISGLFAAALVTFSSVMAVNARFAHNDIYLAFFIIIVAYCLIKYRISGSRLWLYGAFFSTGLAASSKYNGGSVLLAVAIVYLITEWKSIKHNLLRTGETLFIGVALSFLGFVIGTPKALISMGFYFKNVITALLHHAQYGRQPGAVIGLLGQWEILSSALSPVIFLLVLASLIYFIVKALMVYTGRISSDRYRMDLIVMLIVIIAAVNLPILFSYNYQERFFLPMVPLFAVLFALSLDDIYYLARQHSSRVLQAAVLLVSAAVLVFSVLRTTSVGMLFVNDNRISASQYLTTLPTGDRIEHTLYPPKIPEKHFSKIFNYPIFFTKYPGQVPPENKAYEFNQGETGIEERTPKYFIIDSFTYARFNNDYICQNNSIECEFFERLLAGETNYQLIETFDYILPSFMPKETPAFLNPVILIYQRGN
jgi:4-amino-4-deoxy-L-arabinose transferase-like glycosyltransferase